MSKPNIAIIAAIANNGAIGFKGKIPWRIKEELELFRQKTAGGWLICGKTTYQNHLAVLQDTEDRIIVPIGSWFHNRSLGEAIQYCQALQPDRKIWICGGARLYCEALQLPLVTEMHISWIDANPIADTFYPNIQYNSTVANYSTGLACWCVKEKITEFSNFKHIVYERIEQCSQSI